MKDRSLLGAWAFFGSAVLYVALVGPVALSLTARWACAEEAEVPRPGFGPVQPTPSPSPPPAPITAPSPAPAIAPAPAGLTIPDYLKTIYCFTCHTDENLAKLSADVLVKANVITSGPAELAKPRPADLTWFLLDRARFYQSAHGRLECVQCHDTITTSPHPQYIADVTCDKCHPAEHKQYHEGMHGKAFAEGELQAPNCDRCHGNYHYMLPTTSPLSPVYRLSASKICVECHASSAVLSSHPHLKRDAVESYEKTIHGEGIIVSGLVGSATCGDCHNPHRNLPSHDLASSVSLRNIAFTCGVCHRNDLATFMAGVHGRTLLAHVAATSPPTFVSATGTSIPTCSTCHRGHEETRINTARFQLTATEICGSCHQGYYRTYRDTYHGKVARYGGTETALCDDCHGYHAVEPSSSPLSLASSSRIVETCKLCHPYSNEKFVKFLSHVEPNDKEHPQVYYPWLFMTALLIGTMGFFVLHSILWLMRELLARKDEAGRQKAEGRGQKAESGMRVQRFNLVHRITHAILFISVIGLATTGLPLRYHNQQWAGWIFTIFGGHSAPRVLHRIFASLTLLYVGIHFVYLWTVWRRAPRRPFWKTVFGPNSMIPNWTDVKQFFQHLRWFLVGGEVPRFGRWTYWEKFDYWAVFWGVAIIGTSGAIMALPAISARLFPGWVFNTALIIHSDEALLAASFLFAIHFFHVHLRPAKFPLDHVMFTGSVSEHEMAVERPLELEQLAVERRLEALRVAEPNPTHLAVNRVIAAITLVIGLALLVGMFWTEILARL